MTMLWLTRGRSWGFRFLRDGGFADPLPEYDTAFSGAPAGDTVLHRRNNTVAARFPDPEGRKDAAGRPIRHEVIVYAPLSDDLDSVDDVLTVVWPLIAEEYATCWDAPGATGSR